MSRKIKLFGIPCAGGTALLFQETFALLGDCAECSSIDYPGHGTRAKEPLIPTLHALAAEMATQINARLEDGDRYCLFGYSMGSIVTYEMLAQSLLKTPPAAIFLASHGAPGEEWESKRQHRLNDEDFVEALRPLGGLDKIDSRMLANRIYRRLYFAPLRHDYALIGSYEPSSRVVLPAPVMFFHAPQDVSPEEAQKWLPFFPAGSSIHAIGENHFFIYDHAAETAELIRSRLAKLTV